MTAKKGFFMVANDIILHYLPQLGAVGFMLYCTLRRMTDRNDRCYPSLHALTRLTGIEERQIKVELDRLERLQLMQRLQHINGLNGKQTEVYLLPLYPEILAQSHNDLAQEQAAKPGAQLSLHLQGEVQSGVEFPKAPTEVEIVAQLGKVDDPPNTPQINTLASLVTLLVEQMRETNHQMGSLIERVDRVVEAGAGKGG